jgi:hypothetical protein
MDKHFKKVLNNSLMLAELAHNALKHLGNHNGRCLYSACAESK